MKLVSTAQMRAIEVEAELKGVASSKLMQNAGRGIAEIIHAMGQENGWEEVTSLIGSGNNGGDALVALAWLAEAGWRTHAYLVKPRENDRLMQHYLDLGGEVEESWSSQSDGVLQKLLATADVLLDGVLGTGIKLPLKPDIAAVLLETKRIIAGLELPPYVVAVDCPSGVDCDTGAAAPETVPANLTLTMAAVKIGLMKLPAFEHVGKLQLVDIGLPGELSSFDEVTTEVADDRMIAPLLPKRPLDSHKGTFGTALIAAGSISYTGAALLAGSAASRIGAGLVIMAVPEPLHAAIAGHLPEAIWILLPHISGSVSEPAAQLLLQNTDRATACLIGPGLGQSAPTRQFIESVISSATIPMVVDADGLRHLSQIQDWHKRLFGQSILTPHPGEMSALTGLTREAIQSDRSEIARIYASEWGHVVVLKGAFTVVASPEGGTTEIPVATPALARAGTGDVLAGLIVGLRAQGLGAYDAAVAGAYIHAHAGMKAADDFGTSASVLASDILDRVAIVIAELERRG